ncbi:hypothetical protein EJ04DRAFT_21868 [Polyplosphaeria fusca]|uniref:Uncharacterized protein n=1 Tax=Polyplosphaeria fusca TaxID=682080 RepID=A0A9P4QTZ3_9PLEO|nr:hypothetical protein EJ04DRAFT_21868 [Polyplosphaeria fusca]
MHASTLLTEYELSHPPNGPPLPMPKPSVDLSTSGGITVAPSEAQNRSRSPSRTSNRSREPLVDVPLKLTPSVEQHYSAHVTSTVDARGAHEQRKHVRNSKKYELNDWKKYMTKSGKSDLSSNTSSMFSWNSRTSYGERIVQTREVRQEVEVVEPRESRWTLSKIRRLSRETSNTQTPGAP